MKGIGRIIDMLISSGRSGNISLGSNGLLESLVEFDYKLEDDPDYKSKDKSVDKSENKGEDESKDESDEHKYPYWWLIPYQKGLRLILVLSAAVMMITVIIYYGIRYLNDVILYENQLTINEQGAFNPRKSLNCEYALYLFNTAELWANSGILVNEKDRIRINISGGYNSWVNGAVDAARNNREPIFQWVSYDYDSIHDNKDTSVGIEYCISRGNEKYRFGSVMYAIAPESWNLQNDPLRLQTDEQKNDLKRLLTKDTIGYGGRFLWEINKRRMFHRDSRNFHPAGRTGTLFFAVNDMYFDNNDTMVAFFTKEATIDTLGKDFCEKAILGHQVNPKFDYDDNLGQLLVAVEIQRHVPYYIFYPTMAYRFLEYHVNETLDSIYINYDTCDLLRFINNGIIKPIICFFWLILFFIWVSLLFGFYMIGLLVIIYLLFWVGHWACFGLDRVCFRKKTSFTK